MDQNDNDNNSLPKVPAGKAPSPVSPPHPIPVYMSALGPPQKSEKRFSGALLKYFFVLLLISSLVLNVYLAILISYDLQTNVYRTGEKENKIALIDLQGTIDMGTADQMRRMLKRAAKDETVKGVVLVVNSPGGYVPPSEMMNEYIRNFREQTEKKVYVSIQSVGASGAYWTAAATDKIYAQTNSAVGSIGVISMFMVVEKTLKEKLGIEPIVIKSTRSKFKDRGSPFRMPTEEEMIRISEDIDKIHTRFVEVVSEGRKISTEEVWPLANGEVFDGPDAKENKLIDEVGFLDDVIDDLAQELKLKDPMVVKFVKPPTIRQMLSAKAKTMENPLNIQRQLEKWATTPRVQVLWLGQ
ncbi:MAG: signal peptide peptidase SppA [Desulfobulbaceae bacterium]|nr:signal peptide peptidase SppA [Desulfobulbaceae bacterium]